MGTRTKVMQGLFGCAWILWASGWVDSAKTFHGTPTYIEAFHTQSQCQGARTQQEAAAGQQSIAPVYRCVPSDVHPDKVFTRHTSTP
jgi:hypothetical protein